jgi:hypothetical protein
MKTRKTKPTLILMAIALWLGTAMPTLGQTELYKQYSHLKDVTVACIMNFHVNDTTQVELTILAPQTKEAVYYLVEEFNLGIEKDIIDKDLGDEYSGLSRRNVCRDNVKKRYGPIKSPDDYKNISKLVYSYSNGTIVVFHNIDTEERDDVVGTFLTNTLTEPEKFPSIDNANNKK